ncbi:16060_t:CDS:2, partial [Racocetra persica]
QVALLVEGAYISNKKNLYQSHLAKCENFKNNCDAKERDQILALPVAEDKKQKKDTSVKAEVIKAVQLDLDSVTAVFDRWSNVKQEYIWRIVFITSQGRALIWGTHEISSERSKTAN